VFCGCGFPDREIEELFKSSSGREEEDPVCARGPSDLRVVKGPHCYQSGIRAQKDSLLSVAEEKRIHHAAKERKTVT
jgi:hypothetical protein